MPLDPLQGGPKNFSRPCMARRIFSGPQPPGFRFNQVGRSAHGIRCSHSLKQNKPQAVFHKMAEKRFAEVNENDKD